MQKTTRTGITTIASSAAEIEDPFWRITVWTAQFRCCCCLRPPSVCSRVVAFDYTVLMTGNNSESQLRARSIVGQLSLLPTKRWQKQNIAISCFVVVLAPSSTGCSNTFLAVKSTRCVCARNAHLLPTVRNRQWIHFGSWKFRYLFGKLVMHVVFILLYICKHGRLSVYRWVGDVLWRSDDMLSA